MATLDDKLMGEKLHYYCSSSEDEGDGGDEGANDGGKGDDARARTGGAAASAQAPKFVPESELQRNGHNTGPKGVMEDWRRFKQLERENRAEAAAEKEALTKKLAMTCRQISLHNRQTLK